MKGDNLLTKFRVLFLPWFLASAGLLLVYTFLTWLLVIKLRWLDIPESMREMWLPCLLAAAVVYWVVYPRLNMISYAHLSEARQGWRTLQVWLVAILGVFFPVIFAQFGLRNATGTLTELHTVEDINRVPVSDFYTLKTCNYDRSMAGQYLTAEVSGRYNTELNQYVYLACPLLDSSGENKSNVWLCTRYNNHLKNSLSDGEKELAWNTFYEKSLNTYNTTLLDSFSYLSRVFAGAEHHKFMQAVASTDTTRNWDADNVVLVTAHTEPYDPDLGGYVRNILIGLGIFTFAWAGMVVWVPLKSQEERKKLQKARNSADWRDTFEIILPTREFYVTPILILINLLMFLFTAFAAGDIMSIPSDVLLNWGAEYKPNILQGQYWRLLTCMFLHGSFIHILMNMYGLIFAGAFLEMILGGPRFAAVYFITGLASGLASLYWNDPIVSVGASGAIMGLFGFLIVFLLRVKKDSSVQPILVHTAVFAGYTILMGLLQSGVDNAAHIGGFAAGAVLGLLFMSTTA